MTDLEFCEERLVFFYIEDFIEDQTIRELHENTTTLFDKVCKAKINSELRYFLLDLLETIRQAISDYQIRGVEGLKHSVQGVLGKIIMYWDEKGYQRKGQGKPEEYSKEDKEILKEVFNLFNKLDKTVSIILRYIPFFEKIPQLQQYLPSLPGLILKNVNSL